jgi:hypothetical protein
MSARLVHAMVRFRHERCRLIRGKSNADALRLVDSLVFQALVVAVAGVNHVLEYPRLVVPGLTRRPERIGRRNLQ